MKHVTCNYNHCPNDDPTCILKDAKDKADFGNKNDLCGCCKAELNEKEDFLDNRFIVSYSGGCWSPAHA